MIGFSLGIWRAARNVARRLLRIDAVTSDGGQVTFGGDRVVFTVREGDE